MNDELLSLVSRLNSINPSTDGEQAACRMARDFINAAQQHYSDAHSAADKMAREYANARQRIENGSAPCGTLGTWSCIRNYDIAVQRAQDAVEVARRTIEFIIAGRSFVQ